jgi:hypothetical protein
MQSKEVAAGLSKRTILGKTYRPDVHFNRPSVDDVRTTPSVRIYPADVQLLADRFLRIRAGKNLSIRTLPFRMDATKLRPCGRSLFLPPFFPPAPLAHSLASARTLGIFFIKIKNKIKLGSCCPLEKREKKFGFSIPKIHRLRG